MAFLAPIAAGFAAVGSIVQGEANAGAAEYNAAIARQNAAVAQQQGVAAAAAQQRDAARKIGSMVAGYGASGVAGSASALDVLADSARMAELDNLTTKYNYQLKALGYQDEANLQDSNASNSRTSGVLGAVGAGLRGYSDFSSKQGSAIPVFGSGVPGKKLSGDYNY